MSATKRIDGNYTVKTLSGGQSITFDSGAVVITGDLTVNGNATLSGNISGTTIFNGTSNVTIPSGGSNVLVAVGGTSNVAVFTTSGLSVAGNVTSGNLVTGNATANEISATGNIQILKDASGGTPTFQFRDSDTTVSDGTVLGAVEWYTSDASLSTRVTSSIRSIASGTDGNANIQILTSTNGAAATAKVTILSTGNVGIANATPRDALAVTGNAYISGNLNVNQIYASDILTLGGNITSGFGNIAGTNLLSSQTITATGNVVGGNFNTGGEVSATGNIAGGNLTTTGQVSATGNVTTGNVLINNGGVLSTTGNVRGGNIITTGLVSAAGTVTGSYFLGDGGLLSNITAAAGSYINNGNSNVFVNANANVTISSNGVSNVVVVTSSGANITGAVGITGNVQGGNLRTTGYVSATGNVYGNVINSNSVSTNNIDLYGDINWNISTAIRNPTGAPAYGASLEMFTQGVGNSRLNYNDDSLVYADSNGVGVASNVSGTANYWRFYGNGNMRAPGSVVVVGNITPNNASATNSVTGNVVAASGVLQLPVYASNAARDTGISSPTGGMMVFVTNGDGAGNPKFQGYGNVSTGWMTL